MADAPFRVEIESPPEDVVTVRLHGPQFRKVNEGLLRECFESLAGCASENGCFERGFSIACLGTIASHNLQARCCEQAFGVVAR